MSTNNSDTKDREIILTRLLDAPRELVFEAWSKPEHIAKWWGPNGFTTTIYEMEVKPGGMWRYMMHGPDGTDWPNRITYKEVVKPERLVYAHDGDIDNDPEGFDVTTTFDDQDGKTLLTMHLVLKSAEDLAKKLKYGAAEGGQQTVNRLAEYLKTMNQ